MNKQELDIVIHSAASAKHGVFIYAFVCQEYLQNVYNS